MHCEKIFSLLLLAILDMGVCLNKYVDHYETLNYRPPVLDRQKRSNFDRLNPINIVFRSHNRTFHLTLRPIDYSNSIFSDDHSVDVNGEHYSHHIRPHEFLYEGYIVGDRGSSVYGSMMDGIFDGYINMGDGLTFTVERTARYFEIGQRPSQFHSIIYADESINHRRFRTKREVDVQSQDDLRDSTHGCGLTKQRREEMQKFQESAIDEHQPFSSFMYSHPESHSDFALIDEDFYSIAGRYTNRTKRSLKPEWREIRGKKIYEVRTCTIYLQADHKLYEHIFNKEGNRDHVRTREEIVSLLYNHIKAVNHIYENTDFNGINGINFAIQRTTIYTPDSCVGEKTALAGNPFCEENVDVSHYLNSNSQKDHSAFCLAYSLTYRDFLGGTLGLAWVASPSQSTAGGICQRYQRYNEQQRGGVNRSLNTGIITLVNYGNRVPPRVSQLTLAHEIGHNFGSPHDFPAECQPGLPDGNFIMFASATSGDKPNNSKFSRCSIANISEVLYEVLNQSPKNQQFGRKKNCFTDQLKSFCGNQIREDGEECDCGFSKQDCHENQDTCCTPRENNDERVMCRRLPGKICSPSEGICCKAETCSFIREGARVCREESECQDEQKCDGRQARCPDSRNKADGKPCQENTKFWVCQKGTCSGSICSHHGLRDCFLTEGKPEDLCQLACETEAGCQASVNIPRLGNYTQEGRKSGHLLLPPGSPCNNYQGYCDIFRKCRSVDSNGPLSRLRAILFNSEKIQEFKGWVKEYWWACILIGLVIILCMALFVKCCAVHTPSTNPNKLPAQHFSDTLRHPGTLLRRGHPRQVINVTEGIGQRGREMRTVVTAAVPPTSRGRSRGQSGGANNASRQGQSHSRAAGGGATTAANTNAVAHTSVTTATTEAPLIQLQVNQSPLPVEPPPPYQPTDPAASTATAPSVHDLSQPIRLSSIVAVPTQPVPAPLPGAPPPALPSTSSALPLISGLPLPGQGPKPGRRKPKPSPQKDKGKKKASSNEKETTKRNKRAAK